MKLQYILEGGLSKWFDDKWVDISRKKDGKHPPCGRSDSSKGGYPKCVPSNKAKTMSKKDKKSASTRKRKNPSKQVSTESFENKLQQSLELISESMSLMIDGYRDTDIRDLGGLISMLNGRLTKHWNQLTDDQQKHVMEKGMPGGSLQPDGDSDYFGNEGVINYYTAGWPEDFQQSIVNHLKQTMDQENVKYGPFKKERSGLLDSDVIRIPVLSIPKASQDKPHDINLSNTNAKLIFRDILGFKDEGYSFSMGAFDLINAINKVNKDIVDIHARDDYSTKTKDGPQMVHFGLDSEDIQYRLGKIKEVAEWAIENGYSKMYVV